MRYISDENYYNKLWAYIKGSVIIRETNDNRFILLTCDRIVFDKLGSIEDILCCKLVCNAGEHYIFRKDVVCAAVPKQVTCRGTH